jgi:hypothetical protein
MMARRIACMRDSDNKIDLLITQLAKCFIGEPFQMYRREKSEREPRFAEVWGDEGQGRAVSERSAAEQLETGKHPGTLYRLAHEWLRAALDKFLDLLKIILQGIDDGPHFLQKVVRAVEGDAQFARR